MVLWIDIAKLWRDEWQKGAIMQKAEKKDEVHGIKKVPPESVAGLMCVSGNAGRIPSPPVHII